MPSGSPPLLHTNSVQNMCVLVGRCGAKYTRTNDTLWGKCFVGKICASVRPSWSLWGKHTHTYKWYTVGKVHCGENLCLLIGHCGENTHICTNNTLWGKSVRPSWSLWRKNTHTHKWYIVGKVHCGENLCIVVAVVRKSSFPHNANFIFPQCNVFMFVTHYSERRILLAIQRPAYRYTDQSRTCSGNTHAHTIYRQCM